MHAGHALVLGQLAGVAHCRPPPAHTQAAVPITHQLTVAALQHAARPTDLQQQDGVWWSAGGVAGGQQLVVSGRQLVVG